MADPYAGLGSPPSNSPTQNSDPYAGLGTPPSQASQRAPGATGLGAFASPVQSASKFSNAPAGLAGAYMSAALQGFGGHLAQFAHESIDDLTHGGAYAIEKQLHPGQTDQWYKSAVHDVYNDAMDTAQQKAQVQTQSNPYPGHQVGNFAAGVVGGADPSYLVPLEGIGAKLGVEGIAHVVPRVAARVAVHAGGSGVLNAADNSAYQLADMAGGRQSGFNPGEALQAGEFGAAVGGAVEAASPFIAKLFKDRGVDTTPTEDPRVSPLSNRGMSPEQQEAYHQVLATGNQQEIHDFVSQTKMAPLNPASVDEWVNRRDAVTQGIAPSDFADPMFHPESTQDQMNEAHRQAVEDHITQQTSAWKSSPDIEVVHSPNEISDPAIRAQVLAENPNGDALGIHGADGKVRLFSSNIPDEATANAVLYHEALGHNGLAQVFGDRLNSVLSAMVDRNVGQFGKDVAEWQKNNPGAYGGDRNRAAEEVLAEMSQKGQVKPSLMDAVSSVVRNIGRKMGMDLTYSDSEVRNILAMAHDAVVNGTGRDVAANGFKFSSSNSEPTPSTNFMNRSQLAASKDYVSDNLERVYRSLDEHYVPTTETHEETLNRALKAGFKPSQIKDLGNTSNLAVNLARMQSAANMADARLSALEDRIGTPDQKATDAMDYASALADFHYLNVRVKGTKADIARALNIAKTAQSYTVATMEQVAERLRAEGSGLADLVNDPIKFMKFVQAIKTLRAAGNPAGAHVLMSGVDKPYWEQYLTSFHFNAMLSSLSTHVKAPLDMMTGIGHNVIDHVLAMPVGKMYNFVEGITGQKVKPGVSAEEVQGRVLGALRSVFNHEVHMKTIEAAKTGDGSIVQPNSSSQPTNASATYGQASNARFTGLASPINVPMNLITAQDTFFRSVALGQELHGLGARQAIQDFKASGVKPTSDMIRVAGDAHAFNPTQAMLDEARGAAEKSLLLNPNKVTGWLGKMTAYTPGMSPTERIGTFLATNLAPFMRVASNSLITRTIERSPLPLLSPNTWKVLGEGGPQAHLALSRMIYGTVKLGLLWGAADAAKNALTGQGPQNTDKFKELEASGWRPNAVHENGQYNTGGTLNMSLNPFDLHNSTAQMVKDAHDAYDQAQKDNAGKGFFVASGNILKAALGTLYHDMEEGSWIHDMAPALNAADARGEGAGQTAASFAGQEAKTFVPGALNQATRLMDPNEHDTRPDNPGDFTGSMVNSVKSAIPGLAQTLPIRYSVYGDPLQNGASVTGVHTVIPGLQGNGVAETTDPTKLELQRLAQLSPAAVITPVQRTVNVTNPTTGDKKPMKLTTAQFEQYQQLAGVNIVDQVKQLMSSPDWAATPDKTKIAAVKEVEKQVKQAAREQLFGN